jgi:transposase
LSHASPKTLTSSSDGIEPKARPNNAIGIGPRCRGSRPSVVKQTEYDWIYLFAAVNPVSGASSAMLAPTANTDYMNAHLAFISRQAGPDKHVVLILDQAGWHVATGLKLPDNITLLHLPPYSPELNPIERIWSFLKSHRLSNRVFVDHDDLLAAGRSAWNSLTDEQLQSICRTKWLTHEIDA